MNERVSHIRIDRFAMTGPERKLVHVTFGDGVNIIWGASNAGKSFIRKSLDYVFGGDKPNIPDEGIGYDNYLVWLTTPGLGAVTLRRSAYGGDIYKCIGHLDEVSPRYNGYEVLKPTHAPSSANISKLILGEAGFREARLLKNERAEKAPFSLRVLSRYIIVDETRMIDEKSILLQHAPKVTSEDKGLIKFLLTGVDGSSVETVRSGDQLKAARDGKIEIVSQMADRLRRRLDMNLTYDAVEKSVESARRDRDELDTILAARQDELDVLTNSVSDFKSAIRAHESEIAELGAMKLRFAELGEIFASDIARLAGIEEGGYLLQKFAEMNCPLCGAAPEHQHDHQLVEVEQQRVAIEAEIAKIRLEQQELNAAVQGADAEIESRTAEIGDLEAEKRRVEELVSAAGSSEKATRTLFAEASERLGRVERDLQSRLLLSTYEMEITRISAQAVSSRQRAEGLDLNLDLSSNEANELSKVVKRVLTKWNYPGAEAVHFSPEDQDIVVDGKRRRDNGAGIRAILHSAFKVAVLIYCQEKGRPHPGFLILDAPLLAYRPAEETRYGQLSEEELALRKANLAFHFYDHLHGLKDSAQFIIIENHKSDQDVVRPFPNIQFTRNEETGRRGFFT